MMNEVLQNLSPLLPSSSPLAATTASQSGSGMLVRNGSSNAGTKRSSAKWLSAISSHISSMRGVASRIPSSAALQIAGTMSGSQAPVRPSSTEAEWEELNLHRHLDSFLDSDVHMELWNPAAAPLATPGPSPTPVMRASSVIHAAPEEVAEYYIKLLSELPLKKFYRMGGVERRFAPLSEHSFVHQIMFDHGIPRCVPHEYVWLGVWEWESDEVLHIGLSPHEIPLRPTNNKRGAATALLQLRRLPPVQGIAQTQLKFVQELDVAASLPASLARQVAVAELQLVCEVRAGLDKSGTIDDARWKAERASNPPAYEVEAATVVEEGERIGGGRYD